MWCSQDGQGPNSPVGAVGGAAGGAVAGAGGRVCAPGGGGIFVSRAGGGLSSRRGGFRVLPPALRASGRPSSERLAARRALCPRFSEVSGSLACRSRPSSVRPLCSPFRPSSGGASSTTAPIDPSIPVAPLSPVAPSPMSDARGGGWGGESRPGRSATAATTARAIAAIRSAASRLIRLPFITLHKPDGPNSAPAAQL